MTRLLSLLLFRLFVSFTIFFHQVLKIFELISLFKWLLTLLVTLDHVAFVLVKRRLNVRESKLAEKAAFLELMLSALPDDIFLQALSPHCYFNFISILEIVD